MTNKYQQIQKIIRWCSVHRGRDFHYHDVGIPSRSIGALCDSKFRGKVWVVRKGNAVTNDGNNGLALYGLASWVDVDNV